MRKREDVERKEESLRDRINQLSDPARKAYYSIAKRRIKDPDTYAVLVYFFMIGIHHLYLGYHVRGIVNIVLFLAGLSLMVFGEVLFGALVMFAICLMELWDLFRSQIIVQNRNNEIMEEILEEIVPTPPAERRGDKFGPFS